MPPTTEPTAPPTEPESGLEDAVAYVKTIYKNAEGTDTGKDYEVISQVPMGDETFAITWTIEVAEGIVAEDVAVAVPNDSGMVTIDVNENAAEDDEATYVGVDDDNVLQAVFDLFKEQAGDEFDFEE